MRPIGGLSKGLPRESNQNKRKGANVAIDFEKDSETLKALGHPIRIKIVIGLLGSDGCNVNKIVNQLKIPQSTVSQHLAKLRHARILVPRKEGVKTCYRIADKRISRLIAALK
jgi:DNA-binding transcriptional ArsR family regulator